MNMHAPALSSALLLKPPGQITIAGRDGLVQYGDFYQKFSRTVLLKFYLVLYTCMYGTKANMLYT